MSVIVLKKEDPVQALSRHREFSGLGFGQVFEKMTFGEVMTEMQDGISTTVVFGLSISLCWNRAREHGQYGICLERFHLSYYVLLLRDLLGFDERLVRLNCLTGACIPDKTLLIAVRPRGCDTTWSTDMIRTLDLVCRLWKPSFNRRVGVRKRHKFSTALRDRHGLKHWKNTRSTSSCGRP